MKGDIMTNKLEIYKCNVCGNIVEVLVSGVGELVCCDENMELLKPKNSDTDNGLTEKHTPEIITDNESTTIQMTEHPMAENHYIMMVQAEDAEQNNVYTKFFRPNDKVEMKLEGVKNIKKAVSYCNIHGLYEKI